MEVKVREEMRQHDIAIIDKAVAKGAAWLDQVHPGWEHKIDPSTLAMDNPWACVLGQLFGHEPIAESNAENYQLSSGCIAGYYAIVNMAWAGGMPSFAESRGFSIPDGTYSNSWVLLEEGWGRFIKDRFDTGKTSDLR
jgi:hypothetical protein